jgi:putative endonuclease
VTVFTKVRQDAGLLALFLETSERPLEALVIMYDDFWHSLTHPSRPGKGRHRNKLGIYSEWGARARRYGSRWSGTISLRQVPQYETTVGCHPERSEGSARGPSHQYFVYIVASATRRLYVGVTNDLIRRVCEHKCGTASAFTRRYGITRLVCVETTTSVKDAIAREKQIKGWLRCKKMALVELENPGWADFSDGWLSARDSADPSLRSG